MKKRMTVSMGLLTAVLLMTGCTANPDPLPEGQGNECLNSARAEYSVTDGDLSVEVSAMRGAWDIFGLFLPEPVPEGVCASTVIVSQGSADSDVDAFSEWRYGLTDVERNSDGTCNFIVDDEVVSELCMLVTAGSDPEFKKALLATIDAQYPSGEWDNDSLDKIEFYKIGSREPVNS